MKLLVASNAIVLALLLWFARGHTQLSDRISELESRKGNNELSHSLPPVTKHFRASLPLTSELLSVEKRLHDLEQKLQDSHQEVAESLQTSALDTPPSEVTEVTSNVALEHFEDIAEHFDHYDYDDNGLLSPDELSMTMTEIRQLDLNNDSQLEQDEIARLGELAAVARKAAKDMAGSEFPIRKDAVWNQQRFSFLDSNRDDLIVESEYVAALANSVRQIRRFDLDQNGGLTHAELWDAPTRFAQLDLDGDELVYAWEVLDSQSKGKW